MPLLINSPEIIGKLQASAIRAIGEENVLSLPVPNQGSEDFSHYLSFAPGAYFRVGTSNENPKSQLNLHNGNLLFDEAAIQVAASVIVQYVLDNL